MGYIDREQFGTRRNWKFTVYGPRGKVYATDNTGSHDRILRECLGIVWALNAFEVRAIPVKAPKWLNRGGGSR